MGVTPSGRNDILALDNVEKLCTCGVAEGWINGESKGEKGVLGS